MGRVTLQTIADRLGVSRTTASNAWSKPDQLSAELRSRILETAEELGYAGPDPAARRLRSGQVGAIGLLLTESLRYAFTDRYAQGLLQGVAVAADDADTGLLLVPLPPGRQVGDALRNAVVDGVIVYSMPAGHPAIDLVRARQLPLVIVDQPCIDGVPFIGIDDRAATRELTERVLAAGHRRILVLSFRVVDDDYEGPVDDARLARATFETSAKRLAGILEAAEAGGLPREAVDIREVNLDTRERARIQATQVLAGDRPPTVVIAIADELAAGAVDAARAAGLRIPEDLSVVGFDDSPVALEHGLTTVRQPAEEKGLLAVRQLLGQAPVADVIMDHTIVDRGSLGPCPPAR